MSDPYLKDVVISAVDSVETTRLRRSDGRHGWAPIVEGCFAELDFMGTRLIVATADHK
jgi:hypothetical protein